jgi:hypothetical protein
VQAKLSNTGTTILEGVALRISLPLDVDVKKVNVFPPIAKGGRAKQSNQAIVETAPPTNIYWVNMPIAPGKSRRFKIKALIGKCQEEAGSLNVEAAAYIPSLNCTRSAVKEVRNKVDACLCVRACVCMCVHACMSL